MLHKTSLELDSFLSTAEGMTACCLVAFHIHTAFFPSLVCMAVMHCSRRTPTLALCLQNTRCNLYAAEVASAVWLAGSFENFIIGLLRFLLSRSKLCTDPKVIQVFGVRSLTHLVLQQGLLGVLVSCMMNQLPATRIFKAPQEVAWGQALATQVKINLKNGRARYRGVHHNTIQVCLSVFITFCPCALSVDL
jgi:hypothetical protein